MNPILGWLRRNRTLMACLQEAEDDLEIAMRWWGYNREKAESLTVQLHRVARERDKERSLRLAAEELRDYYLENEEE